jgi:Ricin-type beta-trefoil lectin domain/Ricin-type beta-trefoil lectin domain-like
VQLELAECQDDSPEFRYTIDSAGRLVVQSSGKCVDVLGAGTADGAAVVQYSCHNDPNQKWTNLGFGIMAPKHAPGKCLRVNEAGRAVIGPCPTIPEESPAGSVMSLHQRGVPISVNGNRVSNVFIAPAKANGMQGEPTKCLRVPASNADKLQLELAPCENSPPFKFTLETDTNRFVGSNGKCVDVLGASKEDGAHIVQYTCHNNPNQKWDTRASGKVISMQQFTGSAKCMTINAQGKTVLGPCQ